VIRGLGAGAAGVGFAAISSGEVAASGGRESPQYVTVEYDEAIIKQYQPQLVLEGVEPEPIAFHALHATSSESTLNAVYGFTKYPYQEGVTSADSHLGDHEPIIVWYDDSTGDVVQVDYAADHWFRGSVAPETLQYADEDQRRPMFRVDPRYHHYYVYSGGFPGTQLPVEDLTASLDSWLANGLEESLATSQPYDPYRMLGRESWWKHTTGNWIDASLKALWFNLGLSDARETSDLQEVSTW
jgi:hypothetical protein